MKHKRDQVRTVVWIAAAALVVVAAIGALAVMDQQGRSRSVIVLPGRQTQTEQTAQTPTGETFAEVTPENAPALVRSMNRPARYHQTLTAETFSGDSVGTQTVELWSAEGARKIQNSEGGRVRHILTDGETAYLWYGDDSRSVRTVALPENVTADDLSGIPTYETLAELPPEAAVQARYETPEELDGAPCLYVETSSDVRTCYWIDLTTGLLRKAESYRGQTLLWRLLQTGLELPDAEDAALIQAMRLPGGQTISAEAGTQRSQ